MKKHEIREFELIDLEVRSAEGEPKKIVGYAAVFNKLSVPLWGFREKIAVGAFANTIKTDDIRATWNHDSKYVLGRNKSNTLLLEEDKRGLRMEITPPETVWAKDLMVSIDRGDIDQGSFRFETLKDEWDQTNKDDIIRTLVELRLEDVSVVTYPAYPQTSVNVRTAEDVYQEYLAAESQADEAAAEEERKRRDQEIAVRQRELDLLEKEI